MHSLNSCSQRRQKAALCRVLWMCGVLWIFGLMGGAVAQDRLQGFGSSEARPRTLGFGRYAEIWPQVTVADTSQAQSWMKQYDKNKSGVLEREDTVSWSAEAHQMYDLNGDGKMLLDELTLGIANARLKKAFDAREKQRLAQEAQKKAAQQKAAQEAAPVADNPPPTRRVDPTLLARLTMCDNLSRELIGEFDGNGNGQLDHAEWKNSGRRFATYSGGADINSDTVIELPELASWLARRLPPLATSRLAQPLQAFDRDGDGQITMPEYATPPSKDKFIQFRSLDQNDDGLISPEESHTAPVPPGAIGFASDVPKVIEAKGAAVSNIWIGEDIDIRDIDVRVAITKQNDHQLQLFLVGPKGQQVTLFAGGWLPWNNSHVFESTLIDDEAQLIEKTLPRAPYPRFLRTDALKKNEPSLKAFHGNSTRGEWRLLVVNMDESVGVLHHWSLWVKPTQKAGKPQRGDRQ